MGKKPLKTKKNKKDGKKAAKKTDSKKAMALIAANTRKRRQQLKLSQRDLAKLAKVSPAYINKLESLERNISVLRLELIAKALKVNVADMLKAA